jgi:hypothetical protein
LAEFHEDPFFRLFGRMAAGFAAGAVSAAGAAFALLLCFDDVPDGKEQR